jgi:hypothetical protein
MKQPELNKAAGDASIIKPNQINRCGNVGTWQATDANAKLKLLHTNYHTRPQVSYYLRAKQGS